MTRSVYYFNSNLGRISTSPGDFLDRFAIYANARKKESELDVAPVKMILGGFPKSTSLKDRDALTVISVPKNPVVQTFVISRLIRRDNGRVLLIAGDNNLSLAICIFLKLVHRDLKVQISIHADFESVFNSKGFKALVKRKLLLWNIPKVESVRLVSEIDLPKFKSIAQSNKVEFFVSPIPIDIPAQIPDISRKQKLAIVGRLHEERGLKEAVKIILELDRRDIFVELLIVGSGSEEQWLRSQLSNLKFLKVNFFGQIEQSRLKSLWDEIKVVLSCAPLESYGMALREAIVHGTQVVARRNGTTESLSRAFPRLVDTYMTADEAVNLILAALKKVLSSEDVQEARAILRKQQDEYLAVLARSWID